MNDSLLADTSVIVNLFNGHPAAREVLLTKTIWISGITEIETLASPKLTQKDRVLIREFLSQIYIVDLIKPVKELAIKIRIENKLKISDAIIAGTAMYLKIPIYTYDKDFSKLKSEANVVLIDY